MEISKNNDTPTSDDVSQACPDLIKLRDSDTPDSNKGLQDHDSATDSPKVIKPVLGKAQAKKRLLAFANNFRVSPVLKLKEKDASLSKNQTINVFTSSKKSNNVKDLMEEVKDARSRIESELDFQEILSNASSEKKNYKKHKKKSEPKISAIEEIIREESKQKMLLANIPDRINSENFEKNGRDDHSRNYGRYSQWDRKRSRRSSSRSRGDRRRHNNGRRGRSRSRDKREGSHNGDKKKSVSPEADQKNKAKLDKSDKPSKKNDKQREKRKNDSRKDDYKKDKKNDENHYPNNCVSWKAFKSQGGRIRERSLSNNYEDANTDVKFKTVEEYNGHLEQMLMIGSHRLERSCAVADGKNDDRKIYPPESIRVTKCKGSSILYCENPNVSLFLSREQLFQLLPSDRCSLLKKIIDSTKEIKIEEKVENISERTWLKKWDESISKIEKQSRNKISCNKQVINTLPKSKWNSEESITIQKDNTNLPSNSPENKITTESIDDSSAIIENKESEPEVQMKETLTYLASTFAPKVENETTSSENNEKTVEDISKVVDETDDTNSLRAGEKLISEYEQFIKIVNNDSEELKNSQNKFLAAESNDNKLVKDKNVKEKKENSNKSAVMNHDKEKTEIPLDIKRSNEDKSCNNKKNADDEQIIDKNIVEKLNTSDWENEAEKDEEEDNYVKDNKRVEHKKIKTKRRVSSSESSSSSSSSSSDSESQETKKKRRWKKKKNRASSSDSSSSESEESSDDAERDRKKRKRSKRKRSRKKSKTKKRRLKEEDTESKSSDSDEEDITQKKKKQKRDFSKYRKITKRRSKSADNKKVQKVKKEEKIILEEEMDESDLENLKKKIVLETESLDKHWPKEASLDSQKFEETVKFEVVENEKKVDDIEINEISDTENSVKDNKIIQSSSENKEIEKTTDSETTSNHLSEKTDHCDNSNSKSKKFRKTKNRRRSSTTSSSSSVSSSSSSSLDSKNISSKNKTKEQSKRKSKDLSSRLIKKFKKYHSKLATSLDFDALNFPSLTQLEQKISKNVSTMDDWEVDSQDETNEFIEKLKEKTLRKDKKIGQEVRYDSKTDTYIAVEKKSQRENKKKQTGPVCALRIWEDEEEEGEREAMMLMKQKIETDSKSKLWKPSVTENSTEEDIIIISEEPKPVKSPIILEEKEENQSGWVEIIPEGGIKPIEVVSNSEAKKTSIWSEQSPNLKDDSEENLVPVNWEEEEVEWVRTSPETKNKLFSSKKSSRVSSDSSSDSSDSSSSSDSSDSEEESPKPSELSSKKLELRDENSHSSSRSGSKELYLKSGLEEPYVETEAMKKLRMNIFADFVTKDSRDGFSEQLDSGGSSEIPLLVSRIPSLPLSSPLNDNSCFAPRPHEIDSTAEREAIRRGFRDFTPKSDSRSSSHDSRRRFSPKRDKEKPRIRNSEEKGSNSSHQSESRCSLGDSSRDRGRKDDRNLRGHSPEVERKYSPFNERDFREKRRSPISWDRARSRSRSWSRSRSRSPYRRDDRSWDRYKQSNYVDDGREKFSSRSPPRERSPFRRDRGRRSSEKDRSRERSRDRTWSGDRSVDRSYNHLEYVRNEYDIRRKREDDIEERDHWREDSRISKEPLNALYINRLPPDAGFDGRTYHRTNSLDRDINRSPPETDFDKPRYRSRSRERRNRDFDWNRSRESPGLDKFGSKSRKPLETRPRSRLSPRPLSPLRLNRRCRSRSPSWSRSRTYSRSRSRSISRNRSRSRSRSRSSSRSRLRLNTSERSSRFRRSRSLSPQRFSRIDDDRFRRSISQERGRRIETIIHPSGIKSIPLEESSNISESSEVNLPPPAAQYEYPYYQGNNLTYPPRLDSANPPSGSPKRLSLDDRLELELGIKKPHEPSPVPLPYNHPKYTQPMLQYPGVPSAPRGIIPQTLGSSDSIQQIAGPSGPNFHCPAGSPVIPPGSLVSPNFNRPPHASVVQVGNVLQVVPGDFSSPLPSTAIRNVIPNSSLLGTSLNSENPNRVVRVGNVLQVVPTTTLDWSNKSPLQAGPILTNTMHMGVRPSVPIAPFPTTPVLRPNSNIIPTVSTSVPIRPPNKSTSTPPLPITALPKLEPPKAPPVIQPIYNYEAIMEARRKEKEERRRLRAEKRLEKKQKKLERLKRRAQRIQMKAEVKSEDVGTEGSHEDAGTEGTHEDVGTEGTHEDEAESSILVQEPKPGTSEDSNDQIIEQPEQITTPPEGEDEYDEEGDIEEDEDDMDFVNEEEVEDDISKAMNSISQQVDADIIKLAENPDAEIVISSFKTAVPLPSPPKKGILVPPGFWEEKFIHDDSEEIINNLEANEIDELNLNENQLALEQRGDNDEGNDENDRDIKLKTSRQRRPRKSVQFADGVRPGEGTSPSGCEGDLPSPPPPVPISANDPMHEQIKRSRIRKNRKKAKRVKPIKIKKKVKVKIIKLKKPKVTPLQAMMMGDSDEADDRSPPPPPPGSPPPPHLWPSYLAAYSATLRPADTVSPSGNQAPPPPTPLPLLVPPPPLNYTIQPLGKI